MLPSVVWRAWHLAWTSHGAVPLKMFINIDCIAKIRFDRYTYT